MVRRLIGWDGWIQALSAGLSSSVEDRLVRLRPRPLAGKLAWLVGCGRAGWTAAAAWHGMAWQWALLLLRSYSTCMRVGSALPICLGLMCAWVLGRSTNSRSIEYEYVAATMYMLGARPPLRRCYIGHGKA